jgi:hypothetical protein
MTMTAQEFERVSCEILKLVCTSVDEDEPLGPIVACILHAAVIAMAASVKGGILSKGDAAKLLKSAVAPMMQSLDQEASKSWPTEH